MNTGCVFHSGSTLTVYFDPNLAQINLILAQPQGVWIGLHQGSRRSTLSDCFQGGLFQMSMFSLNHIIHVGLHLHFSYWVMYMNPNLLRLITYVQAKAVKVVHVLVRCKAS